MGYQSMIKRIYEQVRVDDEEKLARIADRYRKESQKPAPKSGLYHRPSLPDRLKKAVSKRHNEEAGKG